MTMKILIVTLKNQPTNDDEYNKVVEFCRLLDSADVEEKTIQFESGITELISSLSDDTAIILWCDDKSPKNLPELKSIIDIAKRVEADKSRHAGCIIILGQSASNIFDESQNNVSKRKIKEELLGKNYLLGRPISLLLLEIHIKSFIAKIKNKQLLSRFRSQLLEQQSLNDILDITLDTLQSHPSIGYDRATISLVTSKEEGMVRYLLSHNDAKLGNSNKTIRRDLQKPIPVDKLMMSVCKETTFIISDIYSKRNSQDGKNKLNNWGWEESNYSTQEVNSWIGLAAKHEGETKAVFTLDSDNPNTYDYKDERLIEYLESFGQAFADRINSFFVKRNNTVLKGIMGSIGDKLDYVNLIDTILVSLRDEFKCEECAYFEISNNVQDEVDNRDVTTLHRFPKKLRMVTKAGDPMNGKSGTLFREGKGIIGKVWSEMKPHIVANAQEDEDFIHSRALESLHLSMLVVPVLVTHKQNEERIIGIISCHQQNHPDFFTIYDRRLVQNVAVATANIIERTRILESISKVALATADMIVDERRLKSMLQIICQSAYSLTNVNSASIHLLEGPFDGEYKQSLNPNFSYPVNHEDPPRLDGKGVTDCVINEMRTKEFSHQLGNYDLINPKYHRMKIQCKLVVPLILQDNSTANCNEATKKLLGCLYLDKYQEDSFSNVEVFTLELLARHAAISLNKYLMLAEKTISVKALEGLKNAIESIADLEDLDSLLQVVAQLTYDMCDIPVIGDEQRNTNSTTISNLHTPVWPDLVAYFAEYNEPDEEKDALLNVRAAFPPQYLGKLNKAFIDAQKHNKLGISGLSIGLGGHEPMTYNISDIIQIQKEYESGLARHYIKINERTRSQLSVPVLRKKGDSLSSRKLGVITIEHTKPHAFSSYLQSVIEQFAQHVAIGYEQQISTNKIRNETRILTSLHKSLEVITKEPSRSMLYKAVTQTRDSLRAKSVYVVPLQNVEAHLVGKVLGSKELNIAWEKSEPFVDEIIRKTTFIVNHSQQDMNSAKKVSFEHVVKQVFQEQEYIKIESDSERGFCFPFSSGNKRIGVIWILHDKYSDISRRPFNVDVIKSYVNQIAISYENSTQFNDLKVKSQNDLDEQIKQDNQNVRRQSNTYFILAYCASWVGIILLVFGVFTLFGEQERMKWGFFSAGIGLALEASTILVFRRLEAANKRLDQYHSERLSIGQFNILLSAAEQVHEGDSIKASLIEGAKGKWLASPEVEKHE
jgi:GAF domain-containing protein